MSALVWAIGSACTLLACSPSGDDGQRVKTSKSGWQLEGRLSVLVADYDEGRSDLHFYLETEEGAVIELFFDHLPELDSDVRLGVSGSLLEADKLSVADYGLLDPPSGPRLEMPLIDAPPRAPRPILALLVAPGGETDSETVQSFHQKVFSGEGSTRDYYEEASYGIESLIGDVHGWFTVDPMDGCSTQPLASQARAAAQAAGINLSDYDQIMYYFPRTSNCSWSGLAQLGRPGSPARDSWYNGRSGCVVLAHELGHNYGLQHSGSWSCGSTPLNTNTGSCSRSEYGDSFCPMGGGCWHMNAFQKTAMGWLQECNVVDVRQSGSFAVEPLAIATNGIQTLRVQIGDDQYLYIEYRQPIGFDHRSNTNNGIGTVYQGVLIREAPYTVGDPRARPGVPNLLDMTPGSRNSSDHNDAALVVGASYTSPGGSVTITVDAVNEERAQVRIELADGGSEEEATTCLDGSEPPTGPGGEGDPGGPDDSAPLPHCLDLPEWEAGTTEAVVRYENHKYVCVVPDLCSLDSGPALTAYEPGSGYAWRQAWDDGGECEPPPVEDEDPTSPGDAPEETPDGSGGSSNGSGGGSSGVIDETPGGGDSPAAPGNQAEAPSEDPQVSTLVGRWSCSVGAVGTPNTAPFGWALLGLLGVGVRRRFRLN